MKHILLSNEKKQFRANLHCHSTISDGSLLPEVLKAVYKDKGYSILAITDHWLPRDHSDMSESDFLLLTAYEVGVRAPVEDPAYRPYEEEIHLNFFAKDPHNLSCVCYSPDYLDLIGADPRYKDVTDPVGPSDLWTYDVNFINKLIRTANENGYLVSYNHPVWSLEDEATILSYEGCFSLEIANNSSNTLNGQEYNGALYHKLLRAGKRTFCHAADDNHNRYDFSDAKCDSFGAWTMIAADELSYGSVIKAMETGNMYASTGPEIHEITYEDGVVHIECSPAKRIFLLRGGKQTSRAFASPDSTITSADLIVKPTDPFFFVSVIDEHGGIATSRGYFRDEFTD